ncbi:MAG TPA: alpha/beta fold hydrolase [Polyangiaceae bacterium]|nr:alpha/beta fold hydrolase [Polyangiaceae bacterium]
MPHVETEPRAPGPSSARFITISACDAQPLAATCFEPLDGPVLANVLFLPGIGVPRRAFRWLGEWLAGRGIRSLCFDYRGMGDSLSGGALESASLSVWARRDAPAALAYVREHFDDDPVLVAHSFGGQALGLSSELHRVRGAILVGSQLGHVQHWHGLDRVRVELLWRALLPLSSLVWDPIPKCVVGEALPAGVAREWAFWGRSPDWFFSHVPDARARFAAFGAPLVSYGAWDDPIAPPSSVEALLACFTGTRAERVAIGPGELPAPRVGHFGLLRPVPGASVWPQFRRFVLECYGAEEHQGGGKEQVVKSASQATPGEYSTAS